MPEDTKSGAKARTIIIDGKDIALIDTRTGRVESRQTAPASLSESLPAEKSRYLFQRIDIEKAINIYRAYNCAITEDSAGKIITIAVPAAMLRSDLPNSPAPRSFKLFLDAQKGIMAGSEMVQTQADGTVVTTKETKIYKDVDGIQIPVGQVQDIHYAISKKLDVSDRVFPRVDDPSSIPVVSAAYIEAKKKQGCLVVEAPVILGDPSDQSYTETAVTRYDNISINTADDMLFKIP